MHESTIIFVQHGIVRNVCVDKRSIFEKQTSILIARRCTAYWLCLVQGRTDVNYL